MSDNPETHSIVILTPIYVGPALVGGGVLSSDGRLTLTLSENEILSGIFKQIRQGNLKGIRLEPVKSSKKNRKPKKPNASIILSTGK